MLELCLHDMNLNFDQTLNTCICIPKLIIQDIIIKRIKNVDIKSCLSPIWFNNFLASCKMSRHYVGKDTSPTAAVPLYQHLSEVIQLVKKEVEIPPPMTYIFHACKGYYDRTRQFRGSELTQVWSRLDLHICKF